LADDYFAVFLNETYGSVMSFVNSTPVAFSNTYQATSTFPNYYYNDIATAESVPILMELGKQYYMEVYHVNNGGTGRFSLSVEVPNNDTTINNWQTDEVQIITTSVTQEPEIIDFTSTGVSSGTINLRVFERNPSTLVILVDQNVTIAWNANASSFCSNLNQFSWFNSYSTTCTLTMKDSTGAVVTNSTLAKTFVWRASIAKFRPASAKAHNFIVTYSSTGGSFSSVTIQDHSPLISGTFTL